MAEQQTKHCLEQIARFSGMLRTGDFQGRSRDMVIGQLFYNLGRWAELATADGRALWRQFEAYGNAAEYAAMADFARVELSKM